MTLKVNIYIFGLTKWTIYCKKCSCFCSCFSLHWHYAHFSDYFLKMPQIWVGRTTLNKEEKEGCLIPSSLKFSSLCRENKACNYTLKAWKIRSVYQLSANQKEWNKTNSLQAVKQALLRSRKIISDAHDASKMAMLHAKNREKLPHGIIGRLHNPPLGKT